MISTRYALPVAIILLLALIPTIIHSYLGLMKDDGMSVKNIKPVLGNFASIPSNRNPGWGEETFDSQDWFERIYKDKQGHLIRLFVARSYDHKRLYHHPELALSYAKEFSKNSLTILAGQPEIPVNVLQNTARSGMAAFALLYEGKFIANPISHQVQDSLNLLVSARKPMTLFYISDDNTSSDIPFNQTLAGALLNNAIRDFMAQQVSHP
ncbi:MAG: hypothetical protein PHY16_04660 [Methylobacter sp.]|nr:hypothetical protein [Methylobacter sp.]